jgi:hypothetical protein
MVKEGGGGASESCRAEFFSWGMLERLRTILVRDLEFPGCDSARLAELMAGYPKEDPSLTLGGVGVIRIHDVEDRHVLETAWGRTGRHPGDGGSGRSAAG